MRTELTRRGDYAVRAMLSLAQSAGDGPISARRIANAQGIPARYLPHVLRDLAKAGLVTARPGRNGGYELTRPASEIPFLEVVQAVEGIPRETVCVLRGGPCRPDGRCAVHEIFASARSALRERLANATLADAVETGLPTAPER